MQQEQRYHSESHALRCRDCGQAGELHVTIDTHTRGWSFTTVGFIGLAVNRYQPTHSIMRCNRCWSSDVRFPEA